MSYFVILILFSNPTLVSHCFSRKSNVQNCMKWYCNINQARYLLLLDSRLSNFRFSRSTFDYCQKLNWEINVLEIQAYSLPHVLNELRQQYESDAYRFRWLCHWIVPLYVLGTLWTQILLSTQRVPAGKFWNPNTLDG